MKTTKPIWIISFAIGKIGLKNASVWIRVADIFYKLYKYLILPIMKDDGIITNDEGKAFGKWADPFIPMDKIKVLGISAERYDDKFIAYAINYADNQWGNLLPEKCVPALRSIIVDVPKGDYSNLPVNIALVSEGLVKIKNEKLKDFVDIQVRHFLEGLMEWMEIYVINGTEVPVE